MTGRLAVAGDRGPRSSDRTPQQRRYVCCSPNARTRVHRSQVLAAWVEVLVATGDLEGADRLEHHLI